jgi:Pyridoxal-dependent decarboxylase, C-terminal sheet domain.
MKDGESSMEQTEILLTIQRQLTIAKPDAEHRAYNDLDFAGFTCIESDYLYRGYSGPLTVGDYVIFSNVGSYSIVFKPPFILPNFAIVEVHESGSVETIKRAETYDDLFQTYTF